MDSYHVPSTDPNSLKIDPMVTGEMMETQDPPLVQNELPDIQDKMSLIIQAASIVSEEAMDTQEVISPHPANDSSLMNTTLAPGPKCLICDFALTSASRYDVNYSVMPKSGVYLSSSLNKVLKENNVALSKARTTLLCDMCFNLFDDLELMEEQAKLIRNTLLTNFTKTCELYNQLVALETSSAECQTDLLASDILLNVVKEEKEKPVAKGTRAKSKKPAKKKQTRGRTTRSKTRSKKKYYETSEEEDNISNISIDEDNYVPDDDDVPEEDTRVNEPAQIEHVELIVKPDPDAEEIVPSPPAKYKRTGRNQDSSSTEKRKRNRRVHPCEHCSRMFRSVTEVKNHILVKHLDMNPNQCVFCEKKLNSRHGLTIHLKSIHNVGYDEKKELVANIIEREDDVEPIDESLLFEQQKILEDMVHNSDLSDLETTDHDGVTSEAQDSDYPAKKSRSRSRRKEKENRGTSRSRSRSKVTKVTVPYLSAEGIGEEEFVVKEEKEEVEGEDDIEVKAENELMDKKSKAKRKRSRPPRIGERACMPLIHECPTCGKKWRTVSELNAHIQTHSNLRPWVCEICGQGYKMRKALLVHVGMHNGVHPFTCNYCNKSFTQKVGLEKHMFIHSGTKRYQCDLCGKGFIHLKSYQIHKMIHSGERHIKCDICNLALLSKSHLKQHLRVHTGERPHECEVCGKKFAKKSNLNAHKKKVHQLLLPPGRVPQLPEGEIIPPPIHNHPPVPAAPGLLMLPTPPDPQVTHLIVQGLNEMQMAKPPLRTILKCELCEFTSSRKQSLDEHWEREHSRFINNYTGQYEYAM